MRASCFITVVAISLAGESVCVPILGGITKSPTVGPIGASSNDLSGPTQVVPSVADNLGARLNSVTSILLGKRDYIAPSGQANPQGLLKSGCATQQVDTTVLDGHTSSLPAVGKLPTTATSALGSESSFPVIDTLPKAGPSALAPAASSPYVGNLPEAGTSALGQASSLPAIGSSSHFGPSPDASSLPAVGSLSKAPLASALKQASSLPAIGSLSHVGPSADASSLPAVGTLSKAPLVGTILPGVGSISPLDTASASSSSPGGLLNGLL